jgi:hypothetical protein
MAAQNVWTSIKASLGFKPKPVISMPLPALSPGMVTVTGAVLDANGQPFDNGRYVFQIVGPDSYRGPYFAGSYQLQNSDRKISGVLDGTGNFSQDLFSNKSLTPVNSLWRMEFIPESTSPAYTTFVNIVASGSITLSINPPAIAVLPAFTPSAYTDAEIISPVEGVTYFNVRTGQLRVFDGSMWADIGSGVPGYVTSVALSMPSIFTVTGSPVTGAGTLAAVLNSEPANQFFAAPDGTSGIPAFRAIVADDLPAGYTFADNQPITGTIDGVNRTFLLPSAPNPSSSLQWLWNGVGAVNPKDYTISGLTITTSVAPQIGDDVGPAWYRT